MGNRSLVEKLTVKYPIVQAPMAGVTTPEFVAASAEAGILGSIGAGYLTADETRNFIRKVKSLTKRSFSINLFVPEHVEASQDELSKAYEALRPMGRKLGLPFWTAPFAEAEFDGQVRVLIEEGVKICSFTFGLPNKETVRLLKDHGVFLIGTATTVEEAVLAEKEGMDAVVAQGSEAGGHRGSFSKDFQLIPLEKLLAGVVAAVEIPVIATGGIANKGMMEKALAMGAQAVQIGTALLASNESGANPVYKQAILNVLEGDTVVTTAFSGKAARGIRNRFIEEMKDEAIAPYPYQNDLTKELRKVAAAQGNSDYMSLWAGENAHLTVKASVAEVVGQIFRHGD